MLRVNVLNLTDCPAGLCISGSQGGSQGGKEDPGMWQRENSVSTEHCRNLSLP